MTTFISSSIDKNGSPSRRQHEGSPPSTKVTRRSPRNSVDYDLGSLLPMTTTTKKYESISGFPITPTLQKRPSLPSPLKSRRRRSSAGSKQHLLLSLERFLVLGWFLCFAIGYVTVYVWQFSGSMGSVTESGSNSSLLAMNQTVPPEHYVWSPNHPQVMVSSPTKVAVESSVQDVVSEASEQNSEIMAPSPAKVAVESSVQDEASYVENASDEDSESDEDSSSSSSEESSEEEDPPLVHIVHSRFMQHQPDLIELGLARLQLLEEFFLPSLSAQSSQNFLCVIRIDPNMNATLTTALLDALRESGGRFHYLVVASNANPHSQYWDITNHQTGFDEAKSVGGNATAAKEYLAKSRNILETRLDVDDGLNRYFVEDLQALASDHFDAYGKHRDDSTWKVWCSSTNFEWQFQPSEIWQAKDENPQTAPPNVTGTLLSIRSNVCITAGLSIAYVLPDPVGPGGVQTIDMPSTQKHTSIHRTLPRCEEQQQHGKHQSGCFDFFGLTPTAIRARSPTSAGMYNILWPHRKHSADEDVPKLQDSFLEGAKRQAIDQAKFWNASQHYFDFGESSASRVHAYLSFHMKQIAEENLLGQCTHGHSCKNSSRLLLESILKEY